MGKKIKPALILDGITIRGAFDPSAALVRSTDPNDLRHVSLRKAVIGAFDARGKKLTLPFFEGARFGSVLVDTGTEFYDDEGNIIEAYVSALEDGEYEMLEIDPF